jgi:hypothetical protein
MNNRIDTGHSPFHIEWIANVADYGTTSVPLVFCQLQEC